MTNEANKIGAPTPTRELQMAVSLIEALLQASDLCAILKDGAPLWFRDLQEWYERNEGFRVEGSGKRAR